MADQMNRRPHRHTETHGDQHSEHQHTEHGSRDNSTTAIVDVSGLQWASQQSVIDVILRRRPGVLEVQVNPVAQTATVRFDPARTSLAQLRKWIQDCGYHCAGQSVPAHICDPMTDPQRPGPRTMPTPNARNHRGRRRRPSPPTQVTRATQTVQDARTRT